MYSGSLKNPESLFSRASKIIKKFAATAQYQHQTCRHVKSITRIFGGSGYQGDHCQGAHPGGDLGAPTFFLRVLDASSDVRGCLEWFSTQFLMVCNGFKKRLLMKIIPSPYLALLMTVQHSDRSCLCERAPHGDSATSFLSFNGLYSFYKRTVGPW